VTFFAVALAGYDTASDNAYTRRLAIVRLASKVPRLLSKLLYHQPSMSGVWGWFGGGAAQKRKDSPKNAILGLRSQLDMLQKREKHLQTQMDEQDAIARKNVNTNKNGELAICVL